MGGFAETEFSKYIEEVTSELVSRFVESGGKLNALEEDNLIGLRKVCKEIMKTNNALELYEEMKGICEFHRKTKEESQA